MRPIRLALASLLLLAEAHALAAAPRLVRSEPANGAPAVALDVRVIRLHFDQDMQDSHTLWRAPDGTIPPLDPAGIVWRTPRSLEIPLAALKPATRYALQLNSPRRQGFRSAAGLPLPITTVAFRTAAAAVPDGDIILVPPPPPAPPADDGPVLVVPPPADDGPVLVVPPPADDGPVLVVPPPKAGPTWQFKEELLGPKLAIGYYTERVLSRNGKTYATVLDLRLVHDVQRNGARVKAHDKVTSIALSDDGKLLLYTAIHDGKMHCVADSDTGRDMSSAYDRVFGATHSADGRHVAYGVKDDDKSFVVLDSKPGPKFDGDIAEPLVFSPDGKRLAYRILHAGKVRLVVNHKLREDFNGVGEPVFSPDSGTLAYVAEMDKRQVLVVNHVATTRGYVGISGLTFSPDSRSIACTAETGQQTLLLVNGRQIETPYVDAQAPVFDASGKLAAYGGSRLSPQLAALKRRVEAEGREPTAAEGMAMMMGIKTRIVFRGAELGPAYLTVGDIQLTPDGQRVIYTGMRLSREVADRMSKAMAENRTLSRDEQMDVIRGMRSHVVVHGSEGPEFNAILDLTISPDGRHVAYMGGDATENEIRAVVDDHVVKDYDSCTPPVFLDSSTVVFLATKEKHKQLVRVTGTLEGFAPPPASPPKRSTRIPKPEGVEPVRRPEPPQGSMRVPNTPDTTATVSRSLMRSVASQPGGRDQ